MLPENQKTLNLLCLPPEITLHASPGTAPCQTTASAKLRSDPGVMPSCVALELVKDLQAVG